MTLVLCAASLLAFIPQVEEPTFTWNVQKVCVDGEPWPVEVTLEMPPEDSPALPLWSFTPAAFTINGRALGKREPEPRLTLLPGARMQLSFDLGPTLFKAEQFDRKNFRVSFGPGEENDVRDVIFLEAAEKGIAFMELPSEQLADYDVVLRTNRGDIWLELWAEDAPNHVRNFLDLCYTGFYDGTKFHRVEPTFVIQGGTAKPGRPAPRTLNAEFNAKLHVPGVLSMARLTNDAPGGVNTATCEFFIMHGVAPSLDGNYTAFGRVVTGSDTVDRIAHSGNKSYRPGTKEAVVPPIDQTILKAIVVKAPKTRPQEVGASR